MVISNRNLIYKIYFSLVCLTYITSSNIVPFYVKWVSNKVWIGLLLILTLLTLVQTSFKFQTKLAIPFSILFLFNISLACVFLFHFYISIALTQWFSSAFLYFLLFFAVVNTSKFISIRNLLRPFLICSLVIIFLSAVTFLGYEPTFYANDDASLQRYLSIKSSSALVGFSGIYLNQNSFGIYLYIAISTIFYTILIKTKDEKNLSYKSLVLFFLIALLFLFLTVSRGAILAGVIILLLFNLRNYKNKTSLYFSLTSIIFFILIYLYFNEYITFLIDRVENDGTSSRSEIWADAIQVFRSNPWLGVGVYEYGVSGLSAHNVYINKLASQGVITATLWFLWLLYGLYWALKKYVVKQNISSVVISSSFIAILIHQIFENTISDTYSPLTLFLLVIYAVLINEQSR